MDYPYIYKWSGMLLSNQGWTQHEVAQAKRDKAPQNATHRNSDGTWATTDGITNTGTRLRLGLPSCEVCDKYRKEGVPHMPHLIFDDATETVHNCQLEE